MNIKKTFEKTQHMKEMEVFRKSKENRQIIKPWN